MQWPVGYRMLDSGSNTLGSINSQGHCIVLGWIFHSTLDAKCRSVGSGATFKTGGSNDIYMHLLIKAFSPILHDKSCLHHGLVNCQLEY